MYLVEDGTVVADANAYVSVAFADSYHLDRGHAAWTALADDVKKAAIIRASDYVDKRFGRRFKGRKVRALDQPLEWPRMEVFDKNKQLIARSNEIPKPFKHAISEYALRAALAGELAPDAVPNVPRQDMGDVDVELPTEFIGGQVRRVQEMVDVIQESKTYNTPDNLTVVSRPKQTLSGLVTEANIPEYPAADLMIEQYLASSSHRLRRA